MNETTTTTNPFGSLNPVDVGRLGDHLARWLTILAAALFLGVLVWRLMGGRRPGEPRWDHRPDGSIRGPWLHRWRIRRALRPLVYRAPRRNRPTTVAEWEALGVRLDRRIDRRVGRQWKAMAEALGWPSRFRDASIGLESRELLVAAVEVPDPVELTRRLAELRVIAHTSRATVERLDTSPNLVRVTILDAHPEPIETRVQSNQTWRRGPDGNHRPVIVQLTTGTRWTSLYDPTITWEVRPDPETDTIDDDLAADRVIGGIGSPSGRIPWARGDVGGASARREGGAIGVDSPDNARDISPRQLATLQLMAETPDSPLSTAALSRAHGCTWASAKKRLDRLARLDLVHHPVADGWYLTASGREVIGLGPPPVTTPVATRTVVTDGGTFAAPVYPSATADNPEGTPAHE